MYQYFPACMSLHDMHACCQGGSEEGFRTPATGLTDAGEQPCGCWDPKPDPFFARAVGAVDL